LPVAAPFTLRAAVLHTPAPDTLEHWPDALIVVDASGSIQSVQPYNGQTPDNLLTLPPGHILLPGLIDLHIHAPQWPQLGTALDLPLEQWLQDHTFPLEARYADSDFAAGVYGAMVPALLANGTTTALYFGSIHLPATQILAETCLRHGQRALVGRVAMDNPELCPPEYRDASAAQAEADTRSLIDAIRALPGNESALVRPVITPRFIPACTDDLLHRLGKLAAETGCHVQTHASESDWEHEHVLDRCGCSDTEALGGFGLLTRRSVLAHGNLLGDDDLALIRETGAAVAHCPLSNAYFAGAVFPLRRALAHGVRVGLGTDIAGGAHPSMLDSARMAITASRMLETGVDPALPAGRRGRPGARIDATTALWLATAAGGAALDLPIGQFRPGYQFDAIAISPGSNLTLPPGEAPARLLERIIHTASRANVARVWVAGREVP